MWIDIEDSSTGARLGIGPIHPPSGYRLTTRLDQAGEFAFDLPAADPRATLLQEKRTARARGIRNGALAEWSAGIIDKISVHLAPPAAPLLTASGQDVGAELNNVLVGDLLLSDGADGPTGDALLLLAGYLPAGWAFETTIGYADTAGSVYFQFSGETVLAALAKVAELTGEHFRLNADRSISWLQTDHPSSGLRAVQGGAPVALEGNIDLCLITDLVVERDSADLVTEIYPYGGGNADARLTLANTTRSAPAGYTLNIGANRLRHTAAYSAYGAIQRRPAFSDISPDDTNPTTQASAANQLFDAALVWLRRRIAPLQSYRLSVQKVDKALQPGDALDVQYRRLVDGYAIVDIDTIRDGTPLWILEVQTQINDRGVRTTGLQVASMDRYPQTDAALLATTIRQVRALSAHAQPV